MRHTPEHGTCERCPRVTDLHYSESADEYLCEDCEQNLAEAAWERYRTAETMREQQIRLWKEFKQ